MPQAHPGALSSLSLKSRLGDSRRPSPPPHLERTALRHLGRGVGERDNERRVKSVITSPLLPLRFFGGRFETSCDMGNVGLAPLGTFGRSPCQPCKHTLSRWHGAWGQEQVVFWNSRFAHPTRVSRPPEGVLACCSLGHRVPLERDKEGSGLASLLPPVVPQTLAQRPWLLASKLGGGRGRSGCLASVTFRGPQRRAPGPSPPRTNRPSWYPLTLERL